MRYVVLDDNILHIFFLMYNYDYFNKHLYLHCDNLTRWIQNYLHYYVRLSSVTYVWLLRRQFSRQTISRNVIFPLTKTAENRLQSDMRQMFFITNSSVVHIERLKRLIGMTAFSRACQTLGKHNQLKNRILHEPPKISIFANNFSEASKYSILRAQTPRNFNN